MKHYTSILVAVDLSSDSNSIINRAQDIQALSQAELTVVHVVDDSPMMYAGTEFVLPVNLDVLEESIQTAQEKILELAAACDLLPSQCRLLRGEKEDELVHLVHELSIDLLVLGAHDKHGFSRLFSSTAESLLHALPCDILIVKQ